MQTQVIDENKKYIDISTALKDWDLLDAGFDYHVVSVFGSQSSGKSTLLNHLFSTKFDVMNAKGGRGQTTKGIWMSREESQKKILVMDVEGTDGRERGEDQDFERKSALFSLATSEVLIINMFEQSVGLYNGANMSLLRTVLEVNLALFQADSKSKTCLLFVLRDSTGQTPLESLAETLTSDLQNIWNSLQKPPGKEKAQISDYFDFSFAAAAHKVFLPDKFNEDLKNLKLRFLDKSNSDFLLKSKYHKGVPIDGFSLFAKSIWDRITENKDLDLPTQQQLLAQFRCDEIAKVVFDHFLGLVKHLKPILDKGLVIEGFGAEANGAVEISMELYDKDAKRYHQETYQSKREDFLDKILSYLHVLFLEQLRNLHKSAVDLFSRTLKETIDETIDFSQKMENARKVAIDFYDKSSRTSKPSASGWNYEDYRDAFIRELDELTNQRKEDQLLKVVQLAEKSMSFKLSEILGGLFRECSDSLWTDVVDTFNSVMISGKEQLSVKIAGIGIKESIASTTITEFNITGWNLLLQLIKEEVSDTAVIEKLKRKFDSVFRYNEKGFPRIWKPTDDIDSLFATAKTSSDQLLLLLSKFEYDAKEIDPDIQKSDGFDTNGFVLLNSVRMASLKERFNRESDGLYLDAKRAIVTSNSAVPPWFIVLTIALGWNEFMAILRNPLLTMLLLMVLGATYLIWYTNMSGPVLQVVKVSTQEFGRQFSDQLRERGFDTNHIKDQVIAKVVAFLRPDDREEEKKEDIPLEPLK